MTAFENGSVVGCEANGEVREELKRRLAALKEEDTSLPAPNDTNFMQALRDKCARADAIHRKNAGVLADGSTARYHDQKHTSPGYRGKLRLSRRGNASSPDTMIEKHRRIAQLVALGYDNNTIAQMVDMQPGTVSMIKRQPAVQLVTAVLTRKEDSNVIQVTEKIAQFADTAFEVVKQAVTDEDTPILDRARLAFKALAIAGHSPVHKVAVKSMNVTLSRNDVKALLARAQTANMLADNVQELIE